MCVCVNDAVGRLQEDRLLLETGYESRRATLRWMQGPGEALAATWAQCLEPRRHAKMPREQQHRQSWRLRHRGLYKVVGVLFRQRATVELSCRRLRLLLPQWRPRGRFRALHLHSLATGSRRVVVAQPCASRVAQHDRQRSSGSVLPLPGLRRTFYRMHTCSRCLLQSLVKAASAAMVASLLLRLLLLVVEAEAVVVLFRLHLSSALATPLAVVYTV